MSVDLPEPDTPVTHTKSPTGRLSVTFAQVVAGGAGDREHARGIGAQAMRRHRDLPMAGEILAGERMRREPDLLGRALRDDLPAVLAGARSHVDDVVRCADRIVVVLDDDHAVAEIAQVLQRREQAVVVALVQADRRLVQHVHDAGEPGSDLRGEADPLRLAAGERLRRAVERQVIEADVVEEREPAHDLLDDLLGDRELLAFELQIARNRPIASLSGERRYLEDRARRGAFADLDEARLAPQPRAAAFGAGLRS